MQERKNRTFSREQLDAQRALFDLSQQLPRYYKFKVMFELALAYGLLLVLALPALIVALAIKVKLGGPIFVKQLRVGRFGVPFYLYKFRTMYVDALPVTEIGYEPFSKIENDPRIAGRLGYFLRKYKLDELPQILNVILGDMCLVGPRPYIYSETLLIPEQYYKRYLVRPGITGPWQVLFKNDITKEEKLDSDENYVENLSFSSDIKILFSTAFFIWSGEKHVAKGSEHNVSKAA